MPDTRFIADAAHRLVPGAFAFEFFTPGLPRIAAVAGAEFLIVDMEHSRLDFGTLGPLLASAHGVLPIVVRVSDHSRSHLTRALDLGASAIMCPNVESQEQARALTRAVRYPPSGNRGAAFGMPHDGYAAGDPLAVMAAADRQVGVLAQIESARGLAAASAIAHTEGVLGLWLGQFDFTMSLGIPARFDAERYLKARSAIAAAARSAGKPAGMVCASAEEMAGAVAAGYRLICAKPDISLFREALAAQVALALGQELP